MGATWNKDGQAGCIPSTEACDKSVELFGLGTGLSWYQRAWGGEYTQQAVTIRGSFCSKVL